MIIVVVYIYMCVLFIFKDKLFEKHQSPVSSSDLYRESIFIFPLILADIVKQTSSIICIQ